MLKTRSAISSSKERKPQVSRWHDQGRRVIAESTVASCILLVFGIPQEKSIREVTEG